MELWYIHCLDSQDKKKVETAALKLGKLNSHKAVPKLLEVYERVSGALYIPEVFGQLEPKDAIPVLFKAIESETKMFITECENSNEGMKYTEWGKTFIYLTLLNTIYSNKPEELIPLLIDEIKKKSSIRYLSVNLLAEHNIKENSIVPLMIDLLKDRCHKVRYEAAHVLAIFGSDARSAISELSKILDRDLNENVRSASAVAISRILSIDSIEHLKYALLDKSDIVRIMVVNELGSLGPSAKKVLPEIANLLKDSKKEVRAEVANAISKIGSADNNINSIIKNINIDNVEECFYKYNQIMKIIGK